MQPGVYGAKKKKDTISSISIMLIPGSVKFLYSRLLTANLIQFPLHSLTAVCVHWNLVYFTLQANIQSLSTISVCQVPISQAGLSGEHQQRFPNFGEATRLLVSHMT